MTLLLFSNKGSVAQGSQPSAIFCTFVGTTILYFGNDRRGEDRGKTFHSYPNGRQLFRMGLLMTQKVMDGRGDDQGQDHRDQDSTNYSDGQRL